MDWHTRYLQQASWTAQLRAYLFQKAGLSSAEQILDLGCGTGALLESLPANPSASVFGLDVNLPALQQARFHAPNANLTGGEGACLPYPTASFDLVFCHFVLLWTPNPLDIVTEMRRVTRPGGAVLALAEPDYGGRIDYPPKLAPIGQWQAESLRRQGADPEMGRKLAGIFARAGLKQIENGILGSQWMHPTASGDTNLEWAVLDSDLAGQISTQDLQNLRQIEADAIDNGERILFVPTFYACGRV